MISLLLLLSVHQPVTAPIQGDQAREELVATYSRMDAALKARSENGVESFLEPDAQAVELDGSVRSGRERMAGLKQILGLAGVSLATSVERVNTSGGTATVDAVVKVTGTVPGPHKKPRQIRVELSLRDTWRKEAGGWRMIRSDAIRARIWSDGRLVGDEAPDPWISPTGRAELIRSLKAAALPLPAPDSAEFIDFAGLDPLFREARIVGLGEGSHGSHTLALLKSRLARYLVERHGHTVIALEACWFDLEPVERYLLSGEGTAEGVVRSVYGEWTTRDDVELIRWVREYNLHRGSRPPVIVTSTDLLAVSPALRRIRRWSAALAPAARRDTRRLLQGADEWVMQGQVKLKRQKRQVERLLAWMDANRTALVAAAGAGAFRDSRHAARLIWQVFDAQAGDFWPERDRAMAENLKWLAEEKYPGAKIAILAHNGHVGLLRFSKGPTLGEYLRNRYGNKYAILGSTFGVGQIRVKVEDAKDDALVVQTVKPAETSSGEGLFGQLGLHCFALDLRHARKDGLVGKWLYTPQVLRDIGNGYNLAHDQTYHNLVRMPLVYDALLYVDRSAAEQPAR